MISQIHANSHFMVTKVCYVMTLSGEKRSCTKIVKSWIIGKKGIIEKYFLQIPLKESYTDKQVCLY